MPRVSRKQAEQHRKDVIKAASRLFQEHGFDGVSVPTLMAEAGLTHGAFYGQFASKEALAVAACAEAFEAKQKFYDDISSRHIGDGEAARAVYIKRYTRSAHRDALAEGCPIAALCGDVARKSAKGPIRSAYVDGLKSLLDRMAALLSRGKRAAPRADVLATASMLVGALMLSRATQGHQISDEFLAAARKVLLDT